MEFVAGLQQKGATAWSLVSDRRVALVEVAEPKQREGRWFELAWQLRSTCSVMCCSLTRTRCKII
jgi:hypothetical protein